MPYIPQNRRGLDPETAGELNYAFTELAIQYIARKKLSYQTLNDIVGALENCKLEMTRRVTNDYEDKAISRNGDCYPQNDI